MKKKAQVSDRFRDFNANLTTRPWIVIGMGLRKFNQLISIKTWIGYGIWALIAVVYLLTFVRFILFVEPEDYPCIDIGEGRRIPRGPTMVFELRRAQKHAIQTLRPTCFLDIRCSCKPIVHEDAARVCACTFFEQSAEDRGKRKCWVVRVSVW